MIGAHAANRAEQAPYPRLAASVAFLPILLKVGSVRPLGVVRTDPHHAQVVAGLVETLWQ